jgi:hypothetical protein
LGESRRFKRLFIANQEKKDRRVPARQPGSFSLVRRKENEPKETAFPAGGIFVASWVSYYHRKVKLSRALSRGALLVFCVAKKSKSKVVILRFSTAAVESAADMKIKPMQTTSFPENPPCINSDEIHSKQYY